MRFTLHLEELGVALIRIGILQNVTFLRVMTKHHNYSWILLSWSLLFSLCISHDMLCKRYPIISQYWLKILSISPWEFSRSAYYQYLIFCRRFQNWLNMPIHDFFSNVFAISFMKKLKISGQADLVHTRRSTKCIKYFKEFFMVGS